MTANDTISQIRAILGATDTDPARLAVAAFKLGATFESSTPSMTKTEARRIAGCHVASASDLDAILSALSRANLIRVEDLESGQRGRPTTLITAK